MRIGLTGAKGTLGRRIAEQLLASGHDVVSFDGDIRESDMLAAWVVGMDYVIHSAAVVPVEKVRDELANAIHVNVIGAMNVAEAVAKQGGCGLAYISSSHVYSPGDERLAEEAPTRPSSQYGLTKLQGEQWVLSVMRDALVIRVFSFFDPNQPTTFLIPALTQRIRAADHGAVLPLRGAQCRRDIGDASWVAGVIVSLVEKRVAGIINCGTGASYLVKEIAEMLAAAMGRTDISWQCFPEDAVNTLAADTQKLARALEGAPAFDLERSLSDYAAVII